MPNGRLPQADGVIWNATQAINKFVRSERTWG